jgi:TolA-binding protein
LGELAFEAERFAEARSAFSRVADGFPAHDLTPQAVERIARCWFREADFPSAEKEARRALTFNIGNEARDRLLKLVSFSILKQAENAEAEKRLGEAVSHFFRLAEEFKDGDVAQVSLYRAAEDLRTLGREQEAADVFRKLADNYRGGKFSESALTLSSEILSSLGDWRGVGQNYEDLYRLKPDGPEASSHLFRAAVAREKAGMKKESAGLFQEFAKTFPADPRRAQAIYRQGLILQELGEEAQALDCYRAVWAATAEGPEAVYRAKAALALGRKELSLFSEVELKGNLKAALAKKEKLLDQSLGYLVDAAALPFPDTLAESLYRGGEAFEQMKTALLDSERPAGMSDEEKEQYQFLLEEKAFPLEEQSIEYYRRGVQAVRTMGAHNEWVDRMYARLEVILPWAYQRSEQSSGAWVAPGYPRSVWERSK